MHFTESLRRRDKLKIFHQKLNELSAASVRCGSTVRRYAVLATESLLGASVRVTAGAV